MKTFAIGDIHGCLHELVKLLEYVEGNRKDGDQIIFTGDYVDRGFHSAQVIDTLIELKKKYPTTIFLKGNHEDMFMAYIGLDGMFGDMFHYNGGSSTLISYSGIQLPSLKVFVEMSLTDQEELTSSISSKFKNSDLIKRIPENHIEFLKNTILYHDTPDILFVHAGLNPNLSLEDNKPFDFIWVNDNRPRFFSQIKSKPWHKLLVHGHTIIRPNEVKKDLKGSNRINIDTGCVNGGRLTCLVIEHDQPATEWQIVQVDDSNKLYFSK